MKTKLLNLTGLRSLLLLACMMLGMSAWGEEVTFNFSKLAEANKWENGKAYTSVEVEPITLTAEGDGNNGKYYTSDKTWRMYSGGTVKITAAEGYKVTGVSSTPSKTFTISNGSALLECSATIKFTEIVVTYSSSSAPIPSITATGEEIDYDTTSGVIAYTISNPVEGGELTAISNAEWLTIGNINSQNVQYVTTQNDAVTDRTATITLTYTYGENQTASNSVFVKQGGNPNVVNNISDISEAGTYTVQGTIVAKSNRGFIVGDGTGYVYYYNQGYTQADYNIGDKVKLSGSVTVYSGVFQFNSSATVTTATSSNYAVESPTVLTGEEMDKRVASNDPAQLSNYIQYQGTLSVSGTYYNINNIDGANTAIGSISFPVSTDFTSLAGKTVKVTGYFVGVSSSKYYNTMIGSIEEVAGAAPIINAAASVEIPYDATDGKIVYTIANPVNGVALTATSTATWISNINVGDGAVTFETTKNEGSEDRSATITLSYSGAEDVTVTVTQKHFVADYATLPFEFDGGKADIENTAGLTQEGLGSDYGSSPKLKFDGTDDYLILHFNERPGTLTFAIKGNGFSEGTFTIQTSEDGESYTDLETYTELDAASNEEFEDLGENVRYIKWVYTEKKNGNVALGNIALAKYEEPEYYTLTVADAENVTISAAYGDEILVNGESAELESDTEVAVGLSVAEGYELESITATGSEEGQTVTLNPVANTKNAWTFNMPSYDVKINATVVEIVPFEEVKYTLATSITPGKRYIITDGEGMAMGKQNPNNRVAVEVAISDGVATVKSANVYEFVIESATIGEATGYSIYDESAESKGYLYAASSSSNYLKTQKENDVNGVWTITFDEFNSASIVAEGSSNRNVMQYNSSSSLFSCYASASQKPVYLFEKVETPILLGDVNGDEEVTIADVVAIINYLLDPTSAKFNEAAANVDGQDGVTLADALAIINMIIGKQ